MQVIRQKPPSDTDARDSTKPPSEIKNSQKRNVSKAEVPNEPLPAYSEVAPPDHRGGLEVGE